MHSIQLLTYISIIIYIYRYKHPFGYKPGTHKAHPIGFLRSLLETSRDYWEYCIMLHLHVMKIHASMNTIRFQTQKSVKLGFYPHIAHHLTYFFHTQWHVVVAHSQWQPSSPSLAFGASAASACRRALGCTLHARSKFKRIHLVYVLRILHSSQVICTIFGHAHVFTLKVTLAEVSSFLTALVRPWFIIQ